MESNASTSLSSKEQSEENAIPVFAQEDIYGAFWFRILKPILGDCNHTYKNNYGAVEFNINNLKTILKPLKEEVMLKTSAKKNNKEDNFHSSNKRELKNQSFNETAANEDNESSANTTVASDATAKLTTETVVNVTSTTTGHTNSLSDKNVYIETTSTVNYEQVTSVPNIEGVYPTASYDNNFIANLAITTKEPKEIDFATSQMLPRKDDLWHYFVSLPRYSNSKGDFTPVAGLYYEGHLHDFKNTKYQLPYLLY